MPLQDKGMGHPAPVFALTTGVNSGICIDSETRYIKRRGVEIGWFGALTGINNNLYTKPITLILQMVKQVLFPKKFTVLDAITINLIHDGKLQNQLTTLLKCITW